MKTYITKVVIKNFQSHKLTEINFGKFSVIVGATDSGKSAILRAIRFCLYNEWKTGYLRLNENNAEVTITLSNGKTVTRIKGKDNLYILTDGDNELRLTAFGQEPVEEVMNFTGFREVNLFGEEEILNYQTQHSSPFFLSESPQKKAVMIGEIANTAVVDGAITIFADDIRAAKAKKHMLMKQQKELREQLKEFNNIPRLEEELKKIKETQAVINELVEKSGKISEFKSALILKKQRYLQIKAVINNAESIETASNLISEASDKLSQKIAMRADSITVSSKIQKLRSLKDILTKIKTEYIDCAHDNLSSANNVLKSKSELSTNVEVIKLKTQRYRDFVSLTGHKDEIESLQKMLLRIDSLQSLSNSIKIPLSTLSERLFVLSREKRRHQSLIKDEDTAKCTLDEYIKENPICPICGASITHVI